MLPNDLSAIEVRVIGSLIEKELATPEYYPLSLNALTAACNQSSNRDPVMSLDEDAITQALDALRRRGLVRSIQGIGSRVPKYQHLLSDAGDLTRAELAVMAVLALRGPQTHAEIRSRAARLAGGADAHGIDAALEALVTRDPSAVTRLARRPGQKEARYSHLLSGDVPEPVEDAGVAALDSSGDRVAALEDEVRALREELAQLRAQVSDFRKQFE